MAPIHYLNQCLLNVNGILQNKLQLILIHNTKLSFQENAFETLVSHKLAIVFKSQCMSSPV